MLRAPEPTCTIIGVEKLDRSPSRELNGQDHVQGLLSAFDFYNRKYTFMFICIAVAPHGMHGS